MIHATIKGTGKDVVFLPGWGRSSNDLTLPKGPFRLISIDLPGFGQSEEDVFVITPEDYAAAIAKYLKSEGINPEVLIGHSFGGKIAYLLTKYYPEVRLILLAPAILKKRFSWSVLWRIRKYKIAKRLKRWGLVKKVTGKPSADYQAASPHMKKVLVTHLKHPITNLNYPRSVRLIWGCKDSATPLYMGKKLVRKLPNAQLFIVPGDHFAPLSSRYLIYRQLLEVL